MCTLLWGEMLCIYSLKSNHFGIKKKPKKKKKKTHLTFKFKNWYYYFYYSFYKKLVVMQQHFSNPEQLSEHTWANLPPITCHTFSDISREPVITWRESAVRTKHVTSSLWLIVNLSSSRCDDSGHILKLLVQTINLLNYFNTKPVLLCKYQVYEMFSKEQWTCSEVLQEMHLQYHSVNIFGEFAGFWTNRLSAPYIHKTLSHTSKFLYC